MTEILSMENICKSYYMGEEELQVLRDVHLTVHSGDFLSVLGPSGSGKSTLMNIIGCLDIPTTGKYILSGTDIEDLDESRTGQNTKREIGLYSKSFYLLPRMTALQNVELPLIYTGSFLQRTQKKGCRNTGTG